MKPKKKVRVEIPRNLAARVQFRADRTCCVCRVPGKPLQIHHINEDPSDNREKNLAALCLECHDLTQISGGFGRKLDGEQVSLYRDDWVQLVARKRGGALEREVDDLPDEEARLTFITSVTEALRDAEDWYGLASAYDIFGNEALRDKYIERALADSPSDGLIVFLRGMQDRPDLVPSDVGAQVLGHLEAAEDRLQRGRALADLHRWFEAAIDYVEGVKGALEHDNTFSAAFYLQELVDRGLIGRLFECALSKARDEGNLFWEVRCLQELGWRDALRDLILSREDEILAEAQPELLLELMLAREDAESATGLRAFLMSDDFGLLSPEVKAIMDNASRARHPVMSEDEDVNPTEPTSEA